MKAKKDSKSKVNKGDTVEKVGPEHISTKEDLKGFLQSIREKMTEEVAGPVYAMAALAHALGLPQIADLLDNENREIARDIWLRLKQSGMQVRNPPMLFTAEENAAERLR